MRHKAGRENAFPRRKVGERWTGLERGRARTGIIELRKRLEKALPVLYFLFVFILYFSMLSEPYFTDEQDVFYGAYSVAKGKDIYQSFLSQHMPFSYYFAALVALCGARTVFQFRVGIYVLLSFLWEGIYLRNRKAYHQMTLWSMPLIYLTILRTLWMGTTMLSDHWQGIGTVLILLELIRYADTREITWTCAAMVSLGIVLSLGSSFVSAYSSMAATLTGPISRITLRSRAASFSPWERSNGVFLSFLSSKAPA